MSLNSDANLASSSIPQITIKPSKQWVLPPRPRPGRKPNCDQDTSAKKEKKMYKKKQVQQQQQEESQIIESALRSIKDENKQLKQELSKLVFDLKQLQSKQKDKNNNKKRNHLQMEREDSIMTNYSSSSSSPAEENYLVRHPTYTSEDDEISSQISSAPSLISSTGSLSSLGGSHSLLLSNSLSSLSSIKEEEANALKIDEFLTTSYFDNYNNNNILNDKHQTNVDKLILKEKSNPKQINNLLMLTPPPSLPIKSESDDFEFNFLKNEKTIMTDSIDSNTDSSLFESIKIEDDVFGDDWEWK